jgi:hypothetical protein
MCVTVHAACGESSSHAILVGIEAVEADESWPFALVGLPVAP